MESNKKKKQYWKKWLNYQFVVKQITFFLFLSALAVVYIYNGHAADKLNRKISKASAELKDLQGEYKSVTGGVLLQSRLSEMAIAVQPLGLQQTSEEPIVLVDSAGSD